MIAPREKKIKHLTIILNVKKQKIHLNSVDRIHGHLVLSGITDEPLSVGEGDIGRSGSIALIVGDDLHTIMLPNPHTGIGGPEIDSNCWAIFTGSHGSSVEGLKTQ